MKIKVSFFSVLLFSSLILTKSHYAIIPLGVAVLHELGHVACAKMRRVRLEGLDIGIFGARINLDPAIYSYSDEITVCIGGPAINLISADVAAIVAKLFYIHSEGLYFFILASLSLAIVNLLPIKSFDGGRILFALLAKRHSLDTAERIINVSSFLSLFLIWALSLYLLLRTSASLSLFIFSVSVFATIFI